MSANRGAKIVLHSSVIPHPVNIEKADSDLTNNVSQTGEIPIPADLLADGGTEPLV